MQEKVKGLLGSSSTNSNRGISLENHGLAIHTLVYVCKIQDASSIKHRRKKLISRLTGTLLTAASTNSSSSNQK